jgi:hypothetical protein
MFITDYVLTKLIKTYYFNKAMSVNFTCDTVKTQNQVRSDQEGREILES